MNVIIGRNLLKASHFPQAWGRAEEALKATMQPVPSPAAANANFDKGAKCHSNPRA
ncbi:hypothetical protein GGD67_002930 [Bradyrhizobium sp. IAR9]|uniref:hypothetical protein n=1 Tax=Bradyrhizobium sp. IAR9 TaxID=2663841 RepID=UPI0015CE3331|nr:hypothetical protein [Bradyrhizobium sp. IAR9]NYG45472.1 hypothetical protein [Bradyrhizobium sp. IAR9]